MLPQEISSLRQHRVYAGEYVVTSEPIVLTTLLGSCVAACLFDSRTNLAGMNHFMLAQPNSNDSGSTQISARYGVHAMELLINEMLRAGASRFRLQAKIFGGGNVLAVASPETDSILQVGNNNAEFVKNYLQREGIPVLAADLGGHHGRVVYCDAQSKQIFVRKIQKSQSDEVVQRERAYLRKLRTAQKTRPPKDDLWD
jgi:chemotaxis protein CheD